MLDPKRVMTFDQDSEYRKDKRFFSESMALVSRPQPLLSWYHPEYIQNEEELENGPRMYLQQLLEMPDLYSRFSHEDRSWYFYWRNEILHERFCRTNFEDCLLFVYETLLDSNLSIQTVFARLALLEKADPQFWNLICSDLQIWLVLYLQKHHYALQSWSFWQNLWDFPVQNLKDSELAVLELGLKEQMEQGILNLPDQAFISWSGYDLKQAPPKFKEFLERNPGFLNRVLETLNLYVWSTLKKSLLEFWWTDREQFYFPRLLNPFTIDFQEVWIQTPLLAGSRIIQSTLEEIILQIQSIVLNRDSGQIRKAEGLGCLAEPALDLVQRLTMQATDENPDLSQIQNSAEYPVKARQTSEKRLLKDLPVDLVQLNLFLDQHKVNRNASVRKELSSPASPDAVHHSRDQLSLADADKQNSSENSIFRRSGAHLRKKPVHKDRKSEKQDSANPDLDYSTIYRLRLESDAVRESLKVEENDILSGEMSEPPQQPVEQAAFDGQIKKLARSLNRQEKSMLLKLLQKEGSLGGTPRRLAVLETVNELSDVYLGYPVLVRKGKQIHLANISLKELKKLLNLSGYFSSCPKEELDSQSREDQNHLRNRRDHQYPENSGIDKCSVQPDLSEKINSDPSDIISAAPNKEQFSFPLNDMQKVPARTIYAEGEKAATGTAGTYDDPENDLKEKWMNFYQQLDETHLMVLKTLIEDADRDPNEIEQKLEKISRASFIMPDLLIDTVNSLFEEEFHDILIDGTSFQIFDPYRKKIQELFID